MCQSMVDIQPAAAEIRRGKNRKKKKKIEGKKLQGKNIMAPLLHRAAIKTHAHSRKKENLYISCLLALSLNVTHNSLSDMQKVLQNVICRLLMTPNTEQLNTVTH